MAIQSFARPKIEDFFFDGKVPHREGWASASSIARRKLDMLHAALDLNDLKVPPGNRLEALRGKLAGLHSIRVNDQWRVIFCWTLNGPTQVDIVDYH